MGTIVGGGAQFRPVPPMDAHDVTDSAPSNELEPQARIERLFIYPVKSCAGVEVSEALVTETGFDLDRSWMVVDADGEFLTQRELPRMALIRPQIRHGDVVLRAPGMLALHLQLDTVEKAMQVRVWDDVVPAWDMGDLASQWFSDFLRTPGGPRGPYRLVRFDPEHRRLSSLQWTGGVEAMNQFSDGYPLLLASSASLAGLNRRLLAAGQPAVTIDRFRPNIVLGGVDEHDEDRLELLHIGSGESAVRLRPVKPCARCPIPNIDPATAVSSPAVGDMLQSYRRDERVKGAITFGMNLIVVDGLDQTLRVGQAVQGNFRFG